MKPSRRSVKAQGTISPLMQGPVRRREHGRLRVSLGGQTTCCRRGTRRCGRCAARRVYGFGFLGLIRLAKFKLQPQPGGLRRVRVGADLPIDDPALVAVPESVHSLRMKLSFAAYERREGNDLPVFGGRWSGITTRSIVQTNAHQQNHPVVGHVAKTP